VQHEVGAFNESAFVKYSGSPDNVISCGFSLEEGNYHPTQKPIKLMEALIALTTKQGQIVIDPFCGSGSTLVAAQNLKRDYIGFELKPEYVNICHKRLALDKSHKQFNFSDDAFN
ncbi:MAG: site-specific DNA-methyltransferase, partial [Alphaproteobacteria bacterium]|nr:site-specific DNA-methyltransferase [Alphaproteobacteria bacterium]